MIKKVQGSTFKGSGLRVQGAEVPRFAFQATQGRPVFAERASCFAIASTGQVAAARRVQRLND